MIRNVEGDEIRHLSGVGKTPFIIWAVDILRPERESPPVERVLALTLADLDDRLAGHPSRRAALDAVEQRLWLTPVWRSGVRPRGEPSTLREGLSIQLEAVSPGSYISKTAIKNVGDIMPAAMVEASLIRAVDVAMLIRQSSVGVSADNEFVHRVDWQDADELVRHVTGRERSAPTTAGNAELVEAVRRGDRDAFAMLYREFVGVVHLAVHDQLRDADQVADVVQETFARALRSLHKLRDPVRLKQWLLAIARHTAVGARQDRSRFVLPAREGNESAELTALRNIASMVDGLVGGLSRRDGVALRLVTLGFDVSDVAKALGVRHGAAKVVLQRARRRLRSALVLQLLSNGSATACVQLHEILGQEGIAAAGRHAETCGTCSNSARRTIHNEGSG